MAPWPRSLCPLLCLCDGHHLCSQQLSEGSNVSPPSRRVSERLSEWLRGQRKVCTHLFLSLSTKPFLLAFARPFLACSFRMLCTHPRAKRLCKQRLPWGTLAISPWHSSQGDDQCQCALWSYQDAGSLSGDFQAKELGGQVSHVSWAEVNQLTYYAVPSSGPFSSSFSWADYSSLTKTPLLLPLLVMPVLPEHHCNPFHAVCKEHSFVNPSWRGTMCAVNCSQPHESHVAWPIQKKPSPYHPSLRSRDKAKGTAHFLILSVDVNQSKETEGWQVGLNSFRLPFFYQWNETQVGKRR